MSSALAVTDDSFETEVLKADQPVLVDFWATWCGPCKALTPIIDELSEEVKDKVKVVKVDIEQSPEIPTKYGVRSIPTLMIFRNGEMVDSHMGGMPKSKLKEWLDQNS